MRLVWFEIILCFSFKDEFGVLGRVAGRWLMSEQQGEARRVVLAVAAHPDDIEFGMAGTMLRLAEVGYELHYLNLSSGSCGSMTESVDAVRSRRMSEAREAAGILGATWHPSLVDDLEIFYQEPLLRRVAAIIREIAPTIVLTHSPQDYMEDHTNTSRLTVTALFARGMPNYCTSPSRDPVDGKATLYHAMPHGLCDQLARPIVPELLVDTSSVIQTKQRALAAHLSQKEWLDETQGMDSYVATMLRMSAAVGGMSRDFVHAEGWRRHLHFGFCGAQDDPLYEHLGATRCHRLDAETTARYFVE